MVAPNAFPRCADRQANLVHCLRSDSWKADVEETLRLAEVPPNRLLRFDTTWATGDRQRIEAKFAHLQRWGKACGSKWIILDRWAIAFGSELPQPMT